jgi:sortase A
MKWLAVVLAVSGLALVGLTAYRVADPFAGQRQHSLQQQLQHNWKTPARTLRQPGGAACRYVPTRLRPGEPFAMLRIPALGKHWRFAVVEGTALAQLATGPGHVTGTSWPGGRNFAVAAHDITAGNPFLHLSGLRRGDKVIVRTQGCKFTYKILGTPRRVPSTDVGVLRGIKGTHRITLITCWPVTLAATPWRIIAVGRAI